MLQREHVSTFIEALVMCFTSTDSNVLSRTRNVAKCGLSVIDNVNYMLITTIFVNNVDNAVENPAESNSPSSTLNVVPTNGCTGP